MATDRGAVLTLRAAARGVIDFRAARVRDRRWWRRVNALIDASADADDLVVVEAGLRFNLALVGNPSLTEESWGKVRGAALEDYDEVVRLCRPWDHQTRAERDGRKMTDLKELYKQVIGDPDDPEFQKVIAAQVADMLRPAEAAESVDAVIARRSREAEERRRRREADAVAERNRVVTRRR